MEKVKQLIALNKQIKKLLSDIDINELPSFRFNHLVSILSAIGNNINMFYQLPQVKDGLNEETNKVKEKIFDTQSKLNQINEEIKENEHQNTLLLKKEQDLLQKEQEFSELTNRITRLKDLENRLDKIDVQDILDKECNALSSSIEDKLSKLLLNTQKINTLLEAEKSSIAKQTEKSLKILHENWEKIQQSKNQTLESLTGELAKLDSKLTEYSYSYSKDLSRYNAYVEKLKNIQIQLETLNEQHTKNITIYNKYFSSNLEIWGNLKEKNTVSRYVDELIEEVKEKLTILDKELKQVIVNKDKIRIYEIK